MRRYIKLTFKTWVARLEAWRKAVEDYFYRRTCPHSYRPALVDECPARICRMCDDAQKLTREEFFAEFGERYQAMLKN